VVGGDRFTGRHGGDPEIEVVQQLSHLRDQTKGRKRLVRPVPPGESKAFRPPGRYAMATAEQ
jgi:hypothetical protein